MKQIFLLLSVCIAGACFSQTTDSVALLKKQNDSLRKVVLAQKATISLNNKLIAKLTIENSLLERLVLKTSPAQQSSSIGVMQIIPNFFYRQAMTIPNDGRPKF
jgi:hypothetical protein